MGDYLSDRVNELFEAGREDLALLYRVYPKFYYEGGLK
jgi:hypothetical protein